jgi:ribulose-phosphate 3-epimerase
MIKTPRISYSLLASLNNNKNLSNELFSVSNIGIDMIHYDVSDNEPTLLLKDIKKLKKCTFLPFDIHLSIPNPIELLKNIILDSTDRVAIHAECGYNINEIVEIKNKLGCEIGIAINVETPIDSAIHYLNVVDYILFMAVTPGISGMAFDISVLNKIKYFRELYPNYSITIDGGINDKTASIIRQFNPDTLVSGSFILKDKNYGKQVFKLIGQDLNL